MKKLVYPFLAALILLTSATMAVSVQDYKVGDGFSIAFDSKDPSGIFQQLTGDVKFDQNDLENSKFNFSIDVSSISTGNGMKNKKAMTAEWFDQANHPKISFHSSKVEKTDKGYYIHGKLKMKGVERFRKIPAEVSETKSGLKVSGVFWVERTHYKIGKPGGAVPEKLKITYSIPLSKK